MCQWHLAMRWPVFRDFVMCGQCFACGVLFFHLWCRRVVCVVWRSCQGNVNWEVWCLRAPKVEHSVRDHAPVTAVAVDDQGQCGNSSSTSHCIRDTPPGNSAGNYEHQLLLTPATTTAQTLQSPRLAASRGDHAVRVNRRLCPHANHSVTTCVRATLMTRTEVGCYNADARARARDYARQLYRRRG